MPSVSSTIEPPTALPVDKPSVTLQLPRPSSPISSTERSPSLKTPVTLGTPPKVDVAQSHTAEQDEIMSERQSEPASQKDPQHIAPSEQDQSETFTVRPKEAQSLHEALQLVVSARQKYDIQPREARVHPVLMANRTLSVPVRCADSSPEELVQEVMTGERSAARLDMFSHVRPLLAKQVATRHEMREEKTQRLRKQYLELHEAWQEHCNRLDTPSQVPAAEEVVTVSGRTTRRSAAVLGDAVRSDLEMEQIIASLGNEDLVDPAHLSLRNVAKIPDMISVTHGEVDYVYDDTNNIVDDPASFYEPCHRMGSWTEDEQVIFLEKFAAHPKQFGLIAQSLPHKTTSQCVQFYYLHKKNIIDFRRLVTRYGPRKRGGRKTDKKKGNALLMDILKHDAEVSKGAKSSRSRKRAPAGNTDSRRPRRGTAQAAQVEQTPTTTPTPEPDAERRPKRRKVATSSKTVAAAAAAAAAAADAEDADPDATDVEPKPLRRGKRTRKTRGVAITSATPPDLEPATPSEARFVDQNEGSSRRKSTSSNVRWSPEDKGTVLSLLSPWVSSYLFTIISALLTVAGPAWRRLQAYRCFDAQ
ncbi:hypothetical protein DENSPDRAFT_154088 [Dentipellis sp. KUC8613]|nr:hypothetical protein DENSPDRAFT_154088 [Dentipellis sp. KUC8613]